MEQDTAQVIFNYFQNMVNLMHIALMNAYPIIEKQLHLVLSMRFIGNVTLLVCFIVTLFILYKTNMETQGVNKFWKVKLKKRWLVLLFGLYLVAFGLQNIYPGYKLMQLDAEMKQSASSPASIDEFITKTE